MLKTDMDILEDFFLETADKPRDQNGYLLSPVDSTTGYLYVNYNNKVHVCLPYALGGRYGNAAGGEHAIRTASSFEDRFEAARFVKDLFMDFDKLIEFIESGKTGTYYRPGEKKRPKRVPLVDRPADANFSHILQQVDIGELITKYGRDKLIAARKSMTVGEFLETYQ